MKKIWYIYINDKSEGPYSINELASDDRLTLNTLVWRKGFKDWKRLFEVQELKALFDKPTPKKEEEEAITFKPLLSDEMTLDMSKEPTPMLLWILIALLAFIYVLQKLYWT